MKDLFQSGLQTIVAVIVATTSSFYTLVGGSVPSPLPSPIPIASPEAVLGVQQQAPPSPEVLASPSPKPTPIPSKEPKIDCTGPDNKIFKATQADCDHLRSAWAPNTQQVIKESSPIIQGKCSDETYRLLQEYRAKHSEIASLNNIKKTDPSKTAEVNAKITEIQDSLSSEDDLLSRLKREGFNPDIHPIETICQ